MARYIDDDEFYFEIKISLGKGKLTRKSEKMIIKIGEEMIRKFERKYKIDYFDFGCTPAPSDCIKEYNEKVFELLDKKYGKEWRKNVRKDVEYLN